MALSRGFPRVGVTDHLALWCPDFPRRRVSATAQPAPQTVPAGRASRHISATRGPPGSRIILVTTKDQDTDRVWGMRQGAKAYVTKPIDEAELTRTIKDYLPAA